MIVGIDEAGRGALAGPVVAAAVWLPPDIDAHCFKDSKVLTAAKREKLFEMLMASEARIGIGVLSHRFIDRVNILKATMEAMKRSVVALHVSPSEILVDGNKSPDFGGILCRAIVDGDALVPCISAASIVAKVTRDRIMVALDRKFPHYGFANHKGYGTKAHFNALYVHGRSNVHRMTFDISRQLAVLEGYDV